jgi:hypothetical protein
LPNAAAVAKPIQPVTAKESALKRTKAAIMANKADAVDEAPAQVIQSITPKVTKQSGLSKAKAAKAKAQEDLANRLLGVNMTDAEGRAVMAKIDADNAAQRKARESAAKKKRR